MTKKIFRSIVLVASIVLLASLVFTMGCLYEYFGDVQENQLKDELSIAAAAVEENGTAYLTRLQSDRFRMTWIAADGTVLYDTQTGGAGMENHAERTEVREALSRGEGKSIRYSSTLMEKTMYYAMALSDGTVLRISVSRATAGALALGILQPILVILAAALILSGLLAGRLSRRIVQPLNRLDLEHPLENDAYEELAPLLSRIDHQRRENEAQLHTLRQKTAEFLQITGCMNEGLVLLDNQETVLSINPAAQRLFGTGADAVGKPFLEIDRSRDIRAAIQTALTAGHSEIHCERVGREYQFDISRIESDGAAIGAVLLAFDITEQSLAERGRREFTANVSHELKTPLQGIIGSAELIESGMVKPEDLPRFVGHIRQEAARLVHLIEDILRLAQLDEGTELPREDVDLLGIAGEAAEDLHDAAAAKNISVTVSGETAVVPGVRQLIYEILYNLCDNAIKYNVDGGSVQVEVAAQENGAAVTVTDTGIGIPPQYQDRVFERFYRVDKSRSKSTGGTGLGLSIVKHAVQYHHGEIQLRSEENKGTSLTVRFPQ